MSVSILMSLLVSGILMLPLIIQPLRLGIILILLTLLICIVRSLIISSWYGYILFLIYVGGLLVIFVYVASLSPNVIFGSVPFGRIIIGIVLGMALFTNFYIDCRALSYRNIFILDKRLKFYGSELSSPIIISVLMGLGLVLFINLVAVVKICYYEYSSIRPFEG